MTLRIGHRLSYDTSLDYNAIHEDTNVTTHAMILILHDIKVFYPCFGNTFLHHQSDLPVSEWIHRCKGKQKCAYIDYTCFYGLDVEERFVMSWRIL